MSGRRRGYILLYVLAIVGATAAAAFVMFDAAGTMAFETRELHLDARARNLTASGLAWAEAARRAGRAPAGPIALDVNGLAGPAATLTVRLDPNTTVVTVQCRQGRRLLPRRTAFPLKGALR